MKNTGRTNVINNQRAETYVLVCVFMLVILIMFSAIFTYTSAISLGKAQKENGQIVLDSFVTKNSIIIFNNIKRGSNATDHLNSSELTNSLVDYCRLKQNGDTYYAENDYGNVLYTITKPTLSFINDTKLELKMSYTMKIPIYFGGEKLYDATLPMNIYSSLTNIN